MNTIAYLGFLALLGVFAFFKSELQPVLLAAAALGLIPWYFGTRDRTKLPSSAEKVFATLWVWLRRVLCLTIGGLIILMVAIPQALSNNWFGALLFVVVGGFAMYVGVIGQGYTRSEFSDDISLHAENKKRYKWWF